jgi:predicted acyl esterase
MLKRIVVERNVEIPLRDGTILRADVYRADARSSAPAIPGRLPYDF